MQQVISFGDPSGFDTIYMMELELECIRQAAVQSQLDYVTLLNNLLENRPEYTRFSADNGIMIRFR